MRTHQLTKECKAKVKKLLTSLEQIPTPEFADDKGNLDVKKFNEDARVKAVVDALIALNVSRKDLREEGFLVAAWILVFPEWKDLNTSNIIKEED